MATVNLGSIKFNWQGAYAGGTSYAIDDVVSYNGSSYICKLASTGNLPTNTTYWDQMSSAGTNGTNGTDGTDVGTVITTQGDLLYRDGSGLQRLGAGTSGQVLQTGGAGANPSWGTVSSDYVKISETTLTGSANSLSFENVFDSAYKEFIITGNNLYATSGDGISLRFGTGATPSYATSNYHHTYISAYATISGSNSYTTGQSVNEPRIQINRGLAVPSTSNSNSTINFKLTFYDLNNTNSYKRVFHTTWGGESSDYIGMVLQSALYRGTGTTTGIQLFSSSGNNLYGTFTLYGVK